MVTIVFQMVNNHGFFGIQRNRQKHTETHYRIIFVNNQLDAQFFFVYVYFYSLHVSGSHVPIIKRINCIIYKIPLQNFSTDHHSSQQILEPECPIVLTEILKW